MRIGEVTGSYGMYPFMTRVSVGDRPVTAAVPAPPNRDATSDATVQPYNIPMYGRGGSLVSSAANAEATAAGEEERPALSVYA